MAKGNGKKGNGKPGQKPEVGSLVEQPHGGALKHGSTVPGPGRPPSKIREIARLAFAERIPKLTEIVDNEESRDLDKIGAMKVLCDAGGVDKLALTVDEQPEREWTPERLAEAWEHIKAVRSIQQLEKLLVGQVAGD